jgi:hypothetical protein
MHTSGFSPSARPGSRSDCSLLVLPTAGRFRTRQERAADDRPPPLGRGAAGSERVAGDSEEERLEHPIARISRTVAAAGAHRRPFRALFRNRRSDLGRRRGGPRRFRRPPARNHRPHSGAQRPTDRGPSALGMVRRDRDNERGRPIFQNVLPDCRWGAGSRARPWLAPPQAPATAHLGGRGSCEHRGESAVELHLDVEDPRGCASSE